jgi:hypothetical protein
MVCPAASGSSVPDTFSMRNIAIAAATSSTAIRTSAGR